MSIRKRFWETESGEIREAYVVQYSTAELDSRGKRKRHIKTFERKKDADTFHAQVRVDLGKGVHVPHSRSVTVEKAGRRWIDSACGALERSTVDQYEQHLKYHINPLLGDLKLSALTVPVVRAWQDRLSADGRSPAMIRKVTTSLSTLLSDAMERGDVAQNVVKSMSTSRKRGKGRKAEKRAKGKLKVGVDIPTPTEIQSLLSHATGKWRALFLTAIRCGLRSSELRGLPWSDVDLDTRHIHVRQRADRYNEIGNPKSEDSHRTVSIPPATVAALQAWKNECPAGKMNLVFPNGSGHVESHGNIIDRALIPAWEAAGVTDRYSGLHALRHYFVSWCLARPPVGLGLSLKEASERAGHANIAITSDTYGHLLPRDDEAAALANAEGKFG
jgi:integrase